MSFSFSFSYFYILMKKLIRKGKLTIKYDEGGTEIASLILDTKETK